MEDPRAKRAERQAGTCTSPDECERVPDLPAPRAHTQITVAHRARQALPCFEAPHARNGRGAAAGGVLCVGAISSFREGVGLVNLFSEIDS